jgi:hypothetical protein
VLPAGTRARPTDDSPDADTAENTAATRTSNASASYETFSGSSPSS